MYLRLRLLFVQASRVTQRFLHEKFEVVATWKANNSYLLCFLTSSSVVLSTNWYPYIYFTDGGASAVSIICVSLYHLMGWSLYSIMNQIFVDLCCVLVLTKIWTCLTRRSVSVFTAQLCLVIKNSPWFSFCDILNSSHLCPFYLLSKACFSSNDATCHCLRHPLDTRHFLSRL